MNEIIGSLSNCAIVPASYANYKRPAGHVEGIAPEHVRRGMKICVGRVNHVYEVLDILVGADGKILLNCTNNEAVIAGAGTHLWLALGDDGRAL